jgi:hypothetical protein
MCPPSTVPSHTLKTQNLGSGCPRERARERLPVNGGVNRPA